MSQLISHFVTDAPVTAKANTCNGFNGFLTFVTVSQLEKKGLGIFRKEVESRSVHVLKTMFTFAYIAVKWIGGGRGKTSILYVERPLVSSIFACMNFLGRGGVEIKR